MSLQKELCLICECPTADGAIFAVHVDKEKLQNWFLNVCEYELAEEIEDEDKICYFCAWQAEFLWKFSGMSDESLVWWNLDLDGAAKELRKYFFEGKLEQSWVQLKKVELSQSDSEKRRINGAKIRSRRWKCIYCEKRFKYSYDLSKHVKKMHNDAVRCTGGLLEMSFQKALCLICERPTADGAIFAVHVDKEKLQEWFLSVCEFELAEEVEDDDTICYFCAWQAEFLWKFDEMADESLVWWNLDLDDAALELRRNYFEGKLEQCFVQLEKIELPESDSEDKSRPSEAKQQSRLWKCFYCKMQFKYSCQLSKHLKKMHKEAIRWLSMGGGLVVIGVALNDAFWERPRRDVYSAQGRVVVSAADFSYRYGWSLVAAGAAMVAAEVAALLGVAAYLRRYPSVEDMVRLVVPGLERKLNESFSSGDYVVRRTLSTDDRASTSASGAADAAASRSVEALVACDADGAENPLLMRKKPAEFVQVVAPDVCNQQCCDEGQLVVVVTGGGPGAALMGGQPHVAHPVAPPVAPQRVFSELRASRAMNTASLLKKKSVTIGTFTTMEGPHAATAATLPRAAAGGGGGHYSSAV
ncbi:Hypothetical predicted protein [Cloeon dipterum]|uniref:C2H2-type domain-containing protein n=1 Tax=Cloeon dipterum TaxID=197152 RepID=A0A8S1DKM1_9INSE|nr:Hypothetical predicted protein [Cloeon dipterum]